MGIAYLEKPHSHPSLDMCEKLKAGYQFLDNYPRITMFDISTPIKRLTIDTSSLLNENRRRYQIWKEFKESLFSFLFLGIQRIQIAQSKLSGKVTETNIYINVKNTNKKRLHL